MQSVMSLGVISDIAAADEEVENKFYLTTVDHKMEGDGPIKPGMDLVVIYLVIHCMHLLIRSKCQSSYFTFTLYITLLYLKLILCVLCS